MVTQGRLRQAAFVAVLAFFFLSLYATPYTTGDSIWSYVVGHWMVVHRQIPTHDHWAWTAVGQAWTPQEWGFELGLYAANHILGFFGVVLMMSLVSVMTWVVFADLLTQQGKAYPRVWATFAAFLSAPWDQIRAETFSYLFFALTIWLLERSKRNSRFLLGLLPLELIWVNMHGSFALGVAVVLWMGVVALVPSFDWGWLRHNHESRLGRKWIVAGLAMGLISLLNPQGVRLIAFSYWLSFQTHISKYILEWQPATMTQWPTVLLILQLGLFVFWRLQRKEPVQLNTVFWALGTFYMFMKAVRFGSYALITTPWALAPTLSFAYPWLNRVKQVKGLQSILAMGIALGCGLLGLQSSLKVHGTLDQNAAQSAMPHVVQVVKRLHATHPTWRIWNGYELGDALESVGLPVSIDGRTEIYLSNGIMKTYMTTMQGDPGTLTWLNKEQIRWVCLHKDVPLSELLSVAPGWRRVYSGKTYAVYENAKGVPT